MYVFVMFSKFYILFTISFCLLIETFFSNYEGFNLYDKISVFLIFFLILFLQYIISQIFYLKYNTNATYIVNFIFGFFLFFNSSLFFTIFIQDFHSLHNFYRSIILIIILIISFFLFWFQERQITFKKVLFISSIALYVYNGFLISIFYQSNIMKIDNKVNLIKFDKSPNIYFINLDSLQTKGTISKNLNLNDVPHENYLIQKKFFFPKNTFSDFFGTAHSIGSLMKLDPNFYQKIHDQRNTDNPLYKILLKDNGWLDITKKLNNPLTDLLKLNNYNITFLLGNNYFGQKPFKGVDTWKVHLPVSICEQLKYDYRSKIAFYGYCNFLMNYVTKELNNDNLQKFDNIFFISKIIKYIFSKNISLKSIKYSEFVNDNISLALQKKERNFFYIYNSLPGHANGSYPSEEYKSVFRKQFIDRSKKSVKFLNEIFSHILSKDNNPLIFVFGDHGMMLAASLKPKEIKHKLKFYISDIFSIRAAIYPNEFCLKNREELSKREFNTLSSLTVHIFECLSKNKKIIVNKQKDFYKINTNLYPKLSKLLKEKEITLNDLRYENHVYE